MSSALREVRKLIMTFTVQASSSKQIVQDFNTLCFLHLKIGWVLRVFSDVHLMTLPIPFYSILGFGSVGSRCSHTGQSSVIRPVSNRHKVKSHRSHCLALYGANALSLV